MWSRFVNRSYSPTLVALVCSTTLWSSALAFGCESSKEGAATSTFSKTLLGGLTNSMQPVYRSSYTSCEAVPNSEVASYEKFTIPERGQVDSHAIFGVLLQPDLIESYDIYKRPHNSEDENVVVAYVQFGNRVDGHPGVVHGGILSLIIDDALGFGFMAIGVSKAFTANLTVDYRAPVLAGSKVRVAVKFDRREGRKLFWKAQMTSMDGTVLFVEASSLYIIPRSHA